MINERRKKEKPSSATQICDHFLDDFLGVLDHLISFAFILKKITRDVKFLKFLFASLVELQLTDI